MLLKWSRKRESNPPESAWEADAIPLGDSCKVIVIIPDKTPSVKHNDKKMKNFLFRTKSLFSVFRIVSNFSVAFAIAPDRAAPRDLPTVVRRYVEIRIPPVRLFPCLRKDRFKSAARKHLFADALHAERKIQAEQTVALAERRRADCFQRARQVCSRKVFAEFKRTRADFFQSFRKRRLLQRGAPEKGAFADTLYTRRKEHALQADAARERPIENAFHAFRNLDFPQFLLSVKRIIANGANAVGNFYARGASAILGQYAVRYFKIVRHVSFVKSPRLKRGEINYISISRIT